MNPLKRPCHQANYRAGDSPEDFEHGDLIPDFGSGGYVWICGRCGADIEASEPKEQGEP